MKIKNQDFYQRLLKAGRLKKVALIACAHKLLGFLHAIVKNQEFWGNFRQLFPSSRV